MYAGDISMTQILTGGRRFGTISLMTKMMKLELAPEKVNAEEVDHDEYYDQLPRQSHRQSGLQSS